MFSFSFKCQEKDKYDAINIRAEGGGNFRNFYDNKIPPKNIKNVKYHEYCKEEFFKENNILLIKGLMFRIDKRISEF